jgi:hypothetical protein
MKNLCLALVFCFLPASVALAQGQVNPTPQPTTQDIEVVRVSTDLVQTDVMVFDKNGQFVDGLQRDQFELRVDGKPQPPQVLFSVDRRFKKSSQLGFWIFTYNATRGSNPASTPELTAEIEVLNNANGQAVMKSPVRKLDLTGMSDLQRIPFGSQFSLASLPAGRYELNVKITDQIARSSASQRLSFQVE